MTNRPQPLRMPVQLMRSEAERAQCPATYGMCADSSHTHGPSSRQSYPHPASIRAQCAARLLHFDRAPRGLRNPRPVLAPDGSIVQQLPRHRRNHETRRGSRTPHQEISSRDLHASPLQLLSLFMATQATDLNVMPPVTNFAVAHLHAFVPSAPQARHGMSPNIAAVSADAVHFINSHLVRLAVG